MVHAGSTHSTAAKHVDPNHSTSVVHVGAAHPTSASHVGSIHPAAAIHARGNLSASVVHAEEIRQPLRVMLTLLKRLPVQNTSPSFLVSFARFAFCNMLDLSFYLWHCQPKQSHHIYVGIFSGFLQI